MSPTLSPLDWIVVVGYLLAVGAVGVLVGRGQRSTRDYFLGGRGLPWWAATLSILATETSAVTFIGLPAAGYLGDWSALQLVFGFILGRVFLALVFVRVFYRGDHVTVYGFLADRYGHTTRTAAALLFLAGRIVASGVRLYAGCLAVAVAVHIVNVEWIIVGLGIFGTIFTLLGGIRAVVWTDVILGLTLAVGAALSAVWILGDIPGGLATILDDPYFAEKTRVIWLDRGWNNAGSFAVGVIGGFVLTLATHGTDQDIAQRMLTCRNSRAGSLSVLGSAVLILPVFTVFLAIGTLLFFWFKYGSPGWAPPEDANELFPLFIVRGLPVGLAGMVLAGLLAAALSSLTSVLNALSATTVGDFYRPWAERCAARTGGGEREERHFVRASRLLTACWGVVLILLALGFVGSKDNIFNMALKVLNYFYGGLLGAFLLGMLTRRGSNRSLLTGMLASVPVVLLLQLRQFVDTPINAPGALQDWLTSLAPETTAAIQSCVPDVAWPWWILISTTITMAIGALGRRDPA